MSDETLRLTRAQVREVDRISIEAFHVPGVVLMENAAGTVVDAAGVLLCEHAIDRVLILCGGGSNGGDGLAVARHLHNRAGLSVRIVLTIDPARYKGDALVNWNIARAMNVPTERATPEAVAAAGRALIVDAIFGTGLAEPARDPFPALAEAVNRSGNPVLAVDLPSGLDCDTGRPLGACVRAHTTVTFVAEKAGFADPGSALYTGRVVIGDIGCPREAVARAMAG